MPARHVSVSVTPEGRDALRRLSYLLSHRCGRRVSFSETLVIAEQAVTGLQLEAALNKEKE
jgi:hypothetical protein